MATYTITIPDWHPASDNSWSGAHWAVKSRIKRIDREMVAAYALSCASEARSATTKRRLQLTIVLGRGQRACDPTNYLKSLLDALKHARLIVDDSRQWLEVQPVQFRREERSSTEIVLTDIPQEEATP